MLTAGVVEWSHAEVLEASSETPFESAARNMSKSKRPVAVAALLIAAVLSAVVATARKVRQR